MKEFDRKIGPNCNTKQYVLKAGLKEIFYGVSHLPNSFEQKLRMNTEKATAFLLAARTDLPQANPYFTESDTLAVEPLSTGFHTEIYTFTSSTGEWVMKLGMSESPIRGPHPSSAEFTIFYASALDIQREVFQKDLPYLIPEPQAVLHVQTEHHGGTTVILQPFVSGVKSLWKIGTFPKEKQEFLLEELHILEERCKIMDKKFGVRLDFLKADSHFVIGQMDGNPHIVFLDNGPFMKEFTPLFYAGSKIAGSLRLRTAEILTKISRNIY